MLRFGKTKIAKEEFYGPKMPVRFLGMIISNKE